MMRRNSMKRRLVLRSMLLGAVLVLCRSFAFSASAADLAQPGLAERVARCLDPDPQVAALGVGYLEAVRQEASVAHLLERIGERWPSGVSGLACLSARSLRRALADIALRDFARVDVVRVDGWVLARSEARLYALAHLVRQV
ncbi:hypothetical protein GALL_107220 [mine drainage metagenome]|uniref:Uncharacterized protein n=1 Tax=mine drainage metagenome TaxID=410659 RepID=A0A1J5SSY4_9ZZZZ